MPCYRCQPLVLCEICVVKARLEQKREEFFPKIEETDKPKCNPPDHYCNESFLAFANSCWFCGGAPLNDLGQCCKCAGWVSPEEAAERVAKAKKEERESCIRSVESLLSVPCASPSFLAGIDRAISRLQAGPLTTPVDSPTIENASQLRDRLGFAPLSDAQKDANLETNLDSIEDETE